jgi:hypothetical protein
LGKCDMYFHGQGFCFFPFTGGHQLGGSPLINFRPFYYQTCKTQAEV